MEINLLTISVNELVQPKWANRTSMDGPTKSISAPILFHLIVGPTIYPFTQSLPMLIGPAIFTDKRKAPCLHRAHPISGVFAMDPHTALHLPAVLHIADICEAFFSGLFPGVPPMRTTQPSTAGSVRRLDLIEELHHFILSQPMRACIMLVQSSSVRS